ncbi:Hypothetical predicted protein [Olea europaea subsp. europaea]|uniref:Uncharacterized protein n=1 Tax=Olea europaea subsp. europaea TaxID=158383 RepID=A0A8S0P8W4_OLEEU|nr:Hypothetical predicted protein [Olea europaea subsp. europaea]
MDVEATLTISDNAHQNNDALVVTMDIGNVLSDECGYFDWVKDKAVGNESSSVNRLVNDAPNKEDEELPRLFDGLARISEKRGVDISLHMTFSKGKEIVKCDEQKKGSG